MSDARPGQMSRVLVVLAFMAACTEEVLEPAREIALTADRVELFVGTQRVDKPGTFGARYYVVSLNEPTFKACIETTDALTATWSGLPMLMLSPGRRETNGRRTRPRFAIARDEITADADAVVEVRDAQGSVSATFSRTTFAIGRSVPILPVWELAA